MTETAAMHDHTVILQVFHLTDMVGLVFGHHDTVGEELHDVLAVLAVHP